MALCVHLRKKELIMSANLVEFRLGNQNTNNYFTMDKATLSKLLSYFEKSSHPPRSIVFAPGDNANKLYYVISGSLSVIADEKEGVKNSGRRSTSSKKQGKELVVSYVNQGEFIGEMGLFQPTMSRHVTLKTRGKCEIAQIDHARLLSLLQNELLQESPKILYEIASNISKRLLSASRKASGLAFVDVTERIMRTVIELAHEPEALTHPDGMQIKASRQELAKLSGCSREMAGRALKELQAKGRLTAHGKTIVVFGNR